MQHILIHLPAPVEPYLDKQGLCIWLGGMASPLRPAELNRLIRRGLIPDGEPLPGGRRKVWNQEKAAVAKWNYVNHRLYPVALPEKTGPREKVAPGEE